MSNLDGHAALTDSALISTDDLIWIAEAAPNGALDNLGNRPLHFAAKVGSTDLIRRIIELGGEALTGNSDGAKASEIAREAGNLPAALLLRSYERMSLSGPSEQSEHQARIENLDKSGSFQPTFSTGLLEGEMDWDIPEDISDNSRDYGLQIFLDDATVIKLLSKAQRRLPWSITYDELNEALPPVEMSSEQIEGVMSAINDMGIEIVENEDDYAMKSVSVELRNIRKIARTLQIDEQDAFDSFYGRVSDLNLNIRRLGGYLLDLSRHLDSVRFDVSQQIKELKWKFGVKIKNQSFEEFLQISSQNIEDIVYFIDSYTSFIDGDLLENLNSDDIRIVNSKTKLPNPTQLAIDNMKNNRASEDLLFGRKLRLRMQKESVWSSKHWTNKI